MAIKNRSAMRKVRHKRIRKRIHGTPERPRLAVFRSNKHIYAQVIDDTTGSTLAAASSLEATISASKTVEGAEKVGQEIAKRAKEKGVKHVIFDRGGLRYHGAVATLAEGARKGGIDF